MNIQKGAQMEELMGSAAQRLRFHPRATPRVSFEGPGPQLQFFAITLDFAIPYFPLACHYPQSAPHQCDSEIGPQQWVAQQNLGCAVGPLRGMWHLLTSSGLHSRKPRSEVVVAAIPYTSPPPSPRNFGIAGGTLQPTYRRWQIGVNSLP